MKVWLAALAAALVLVGGEAAPGSTAGEAGRLDRDGRRRLDRGDALPPRRRASSRRLAGDRLPARALGEPPADERPRRGLRVRRPGATPSSRSTPAATATSGGLVGIDGPREVADTRAVHAWLAARPDVSDTKIGAWGISYGGGGVFNSLVAGVPWAAVVTVETWTDLYSALMPQGLVKSGLVAGPRRARSRPRRRDPSLDAVQAAAFAGNAAAVQAVGRRALEPRRSSARSRRPSSWRRAGATSSSGSTRARAPSSASQGPKTLYVGLHGHAPSTFPAADTGVPDEPGARAGSAASCANAGCDVTLASSPSRSEKFGGPVALPAGRRRPYRRPSSRSRASRPSRGAGRPRARPPRFARRSRSSARRRCRCRSRRAAAGRGSSRCSRRARPRARRSSSAPAGSRRSRARRRSRSGWSSQATFVPKGSRLTLTLASSSTAQSSANLLYLDLPMAPTARARVGTAILKLPGLRTPVTK